LQSAAAQKSSFPVNLAPGWEPINLLKASALEFFFLFCDNSFLPGSS
jgi:hypothetical protein